MPVHFLDKALLKRLQELRKVREKKHAEWTSYNNKAHKSRLDLREIDDEAAYIIKRLRLLTKMEKENE